MHETTQTARGRQLRSPVAAAFVSPFFSRLAAACLLLALVAPGCAAWKRCAYEGVGRDDWQDPARVVASLELAPGDQIADLGAGSGYFTFRLADAVGPGGRVYAVDVDDDMIEYLRERAAEGGYANVEVVRGEFHDPKLPDGRVDLVFMSNTYHHIEERVPYFAGVRNDLRPDGRVAILELNDASWFPRTFGHQTGRDVIADEMRQAGYTLESEHDFVERQSFLIFRQER